MSTQRSTADYLLQLLGSDHFAIRAMFGEYALYCDSKVVALICDDLLFVKILPASIRLESLCEKGEPYPGARLHYLVEESQWKSIDDLRDILIDVAATLPAKKPKTKKE
ncbi:MAG TPA: TfoX/Sxy family protein [Candidatus Paceibacterota bacterium]|nr:TfoX/Sxy family protein [Candidatus Paceibacterota bacterium]